MAMNLIQFQRRHVRARIPAQASARQAQCAEALRAARWPNGFVCPRCGRRRALPAGPRQALPDHACTARPSWWPAAGCRNASSLSTGSSAIYLMSKPNRAVGAGLDVALGVSSRRALVGAAEFAAGRWRGATPCTRLRGHVQLDDACLGGKLAGEQGHRVSDREMPLRWPRAV